MKIKLAYLGWNTPTVVEKFVNKWFEDNSDAIVQNIEHKLHEFNVLTIITYVEGAIGEQQLQQSEQGTEVPEDLG